MAVKALLTEHNCPLSVPEIQATLAKTGLTPNKTSLYRLLEKLKQAQVVETVLLDSATTYYEIKKHHHHHFKCGSCDTIQCLNDPELEKRIHELEQQLEKSGLQVAQPQFSISGHCRSCQ